MKPYLPIYGYTDYKKYLADFYEFRKSGVRSYSYRHFSKDAGFSAPNVLKLVIDGKRKIGPRSVEKYIAALKLPESMASYFRVLVKLNNSADDGEKKELLAQLLKLTPESKKRDLNAESLEYLSTWLYPTLREMIASGDFKDDPYWISRRLTGRASVSEISKGLRFLIKHGFVTKVGNQYETQDVMVLSSDEIKSLAVREYHRSCLRQAVEMIDDLEVNEREFGALTINLSDHHLPQLKKKIKDFRRELHQWAIQVSEDDPDQREIVQVNMQMYPQSKKARS